MSQQFIIQSETIRDKLNSLLPSQNLGSIGVELTGSTQIIPIVDLTEVAEGSSLRQDLQTSFSLSSGTSFDFNNTTETLINNVGYFLVAGTFSARADNATGTNFIGTLQFTDGTTTKILSKYLMHHCPDSQVNIFPFQFNVFIAAGQSLTATSNNSLMQISGMTRQIADSTGNLVNP